VTFEAGDEKQSMIDRGLTFDRVLDSEPLAFIPNPAHEDQMILVVEIDGYAVAVPCKPLGDDRWLMVTAFRSRKYKKIYLEN